MGIYPDAWIEKASGERATLAYLTQWLDELTLVVKEPGLEVRRKFTLGEREEIRTDCFCCSCGDYSSDPFCRNHGFAGRRPCANHGLPGQEDEEGVMPEPVGAST